MRFMAGIGNDFGRRAFKVRGVASDIAGARLQVHLNHREI
jgi:hypothetical protein